MTNGFIMLGQSTTLTALKLLPPIKLQPWGNIKRDELAKAEVLIPNKKDYDRIGALLQPIYEMIISNRIENKKLAATRDTLLPKLMNGEIDISEVDYE